MDGTKHMLPPLPGTGRPLVIHRSLLATAEATRTWGRGVGATHQKDPTLDRGGALLAPHRTSTLRGVGMGLETECPKTVEAADGRACKFGRTPVPPPSPASRSRTPLEDVLPGGLALNAPCHPRTRPAPGHSWQTEEGPEELRPTAACGSV